MTKNHQSILSKASGGCGCLLLIICIIGLGPMLDYLFFEPQNQAKKAKQSEAKEYLPSINKGQGAYFAEKSVFSNSIKDLEIGLRTETTNYNYSVRATKKAAFNYGISNPKELKSYIRGVFIVPGKNFATNAAKHQIRTIFILCQADSPSTITPGDLTYENGIFACGQGPIEVIK
jgi:type IV pilus assembly protein PilA